MTKHLTNFLLIILIIVVLIDILTGIFYWNRMNLMFAPEKFNNIVTPIVGIVSVIVYSAALLINFWQSKVIQSQHFRPYYEKEIENIKTQLVNNKFSINFIETEYEECNGINFPSVIMEQLSALTRHDDYYEDLNKYENSETITEEYIKSLFKFSCLEIRLLIS